jgi:hypothetical protein
MHHPATPRHFPSVFSSPLKQIIYRSAATWLSDVTLIGPMLSCFFCIIACVTENTTDDHGNYVRLLTVYYASVSTSQRTQQ